MSTRHVTEGCKPTAAVISANMLELQLQTNCRCDICKQHVGITAANQLPLYKGRQREREHSEHSEGERGRQRQTPT